MLKTPLPSLSLGGLRKWRLERGWDPGDSGKRLISVEACEHIVVLNKRDLVPEWGMEVSLTVDSLALKKLSIFLIQPSVCVWIDFSRFVKPWQRSFRISVCCLLRGIDRGISAI